MCFITAEAKEVRMFSTQKPPREEEEITQSDVENKQLERFNMFHLFCDFCVTAANFGNHSDSNSI